MSREGNSKFNVKNKNKKLKIKFQIQLKHNYSITRPVHQKIKQTHIIQVKFIINL